MLNRIFNVVGWLGMALVAAAVVIRFGMPAKDQYAYYLAWGGLVCMLLYTMSQWREIVSVFSRRQARYGTLTGVSVVVVLAILIAINYLGKRQNKRWDLTANQQFSLSDQTKNLVGKLDAPMDILVFAQEPEFPTYRDRLKEYEYTSKKIAIQYIDPDKKREVAQQNQVQQYGTIVFKYKDRTERITSNTEQDVTNAIIKVVSGKQKKIYFTAGHGEKDTASAERTGYNTISTALQHENYTIDKVVIAQQGGVPADADVLVVAGPKNDFLPGEIDAVKKYLDKAGKVLLLLDPPDPGKADTSLPNLIALAHDWGMDVGNNVVVDVSGMGQLIGANESMPVAANYPSHPITERFNVMTVYPLARSVIPVQGGVNGHNAQSIVMTSDRSWGETDLNALFAGKPIEPNEDKGDKKGPVSVAAAVSAAAADAPKDAAADAPKPESRMVVFGDSDFATNSIIGVPGNRDLFMNTIGWLSQQENLISIRPKDPSDRRLTMTSAQQNNVVVLALAIIPGLIFLAGGLSWWRRR